MFAPTPSPSKNFCIRPCGVAIPLSKMNITSPYVLVKKNFYAF